MTRDGRASHVWAENRWMNHTPSDLPEETREAYARFLKLPELDKESLLERLERYYNRTKSESEVMELADVELAQNLTVSLKQLVEVCPPENLPAIKAAAYYLFCSEDANSDLDSVLGFEDDAEVVNCVCRMLGQDELQVSF